MATDPELYIDHDETRRMRRVLDRAIENQAMWILSDHLGVDADGCEAWIDRLYNELRDALTPEDRLRAIVLLLAPSAQERAEQALSSVEVD